ncbi:MAG: Inner membrane protein YbaN [Bacteroidetes bacterium ADurb.Bin416]|nr:MAG: Inner membrane protein YbaN [Bacteroidetes bacterium ADurb.Bin416]
MNLLYTILGSISLALGLIGIVVPVLPTTPFLLLSAALYVKGSQRLYNWLMHHPKLGPYITNFRVYRAIPLKTKVVAIVSLWVTMLITVVFFIPLVWVKILLLAIAVAVTWHILSFKTLR